MKATFGALILLAASLGTAAHASETPMTEMSGKTAMMPPVCYIGLNGTWWCDI
jgi:hypothetical protein